MDYDAMQGAPGETPYPEQDAAVADDGDLARVYDGLIIGGGPAGLSAAIYLARFNRSVLVVDFGEGRSTTHEHNENYLGFPDGIGARELRSLGVRQAARFGARFVTAMVDRVERRAACDGDGGRGARDVRDGRDGEDGRDAGDAHAHRVGGDAGEPLTGSEAGDAQGGSEGWEGSEASDGRSDGDGSDGGADGGGRDARGSHHDGEGHDDGDGRDDGEALFVAHCGGDAWRGRTLIIATGVVDVFPDIPDIEEYVGRSLFWCITCDGWKTRGKRVAVVGATDDAVTTCMQFLNFTPQLTFVTNQPIGRSAQLSGRSLERLACAHIPLVEGEIACAEGTGGMMTALRMTDGRRLEADVLISQQGSSPNCAVASDLEVELTPHGYIKVDIEQRTNVPRVYAAGDVTKVFAHQIAAAVHEGATAGQAANYDLYERDQRE